MIYLPFKKQIAQVRQQTYLRPSLGLQRYYNADFTKEQSSFDCLVRIFYKFHVIFPRQDRHFEQMAQYFSLF